MKTTKTNSPTIHSSACPSCTPRPAIFKTACTRPELPRMVTAELRGSDFGEVTTDSNTIASPDEARRRSRVTAEGTTAKPLTPVKHV
jgi:hypothetical protein